MSKTNKWLVLTVKSLTHHRNSKHYQLIIQNHSIDNQLTIDQQFAHNYDYVYKLWQCKPVDRELVKILMFEKVVEGGTVILAKRGQASPLVNYTSQSQKFQFYASSQQRCVIILKFKAVDQQQLELEVNREILNRLNRNMSEILQGNKNQSQQYLQYLDHTNKVISNWNNQIQSSRIRLNLDHSVRGSQKHKYQQKIQQEFKPSLKKHPSTSRNLRKEIFLSNSKYLNDNISLAPYQNHQPHNQQSQRPKTQAENGLEGLQLSIKKRRELYLSNKIETIIQKRSDSPILSVYKSQSNSAIRNTLQDKKTIQRYKIEPKFHKAGIERYNKYTTLNDYHSNDFLTPQTLKKMQKEQMGQRVRSQIEIDTQKEQIVKAANIPRQMEKYGPLNKEFGTIRRKKTVSQNKDRDLNQDTRVKPIEENIVHISRNSRIGRFLKDRHINLSIFNFKAKVYRSKGRCSRKLILVFEDSKYTTESVQSLKLRVSWKQRFGIRNCIQSSYLYCRLYCNDEQQGEATISVRELAQSDHNSCRVFFYFKESIVGYLQFNFIKSECRSISPNVALRQSRNSLPKIRDASLPRGLGRQQLTMSLAGTDSLEKQIGLPQRQVSKKRMLILHQRNPMSRIMERSLTQGIKNESNAINKIRQKKLKLKAKIK